MPTYKIRIGDKTHSLTSAEALSDDDISEYVDSLETPAKKKEAAPAKSAPVDESTGAYLKRRLLDPVTDFFDTTSYADSMKDPTGEKRKTYYQQTGVRDTANAPMIAPNQLRAAGTAAAGIPEAVVSALTGAGAGVAGGLAGAARTAGGVLSGESFSDAASAGGQTVRDVGEAGTFVPRTEVGQGVMQGVAAPMQMVSAVGGRVLGSVGRVVGGQTGENIGETLGEAAPQLAVTRPLVQTMKSALRGQLHTTAPLTHEQTALAKTQDKGYLTPITKANPSVLNSLVQSMGGDAPISKKQALKNQQVTNAIAREAMGLPPDAFLDDAAFDSFRAREGGAYARVKADQTALPVTPQFERDVLALSDRMRLINDTFPGQVDLTEISKLQDALIHPAQAVKPEAVIELVKSYRADAKALLKSDDPKKVSLGVAKREASNLLEDHMEQHLPANLIPEYRAARAKIAMSHDLEDATNTQTGTVDATVLRALLDKGKPLSGKLLGVAEAAKSSPATVRNTEKMVPGQTVHAGDVGAVSLLSHMLKSPKYLAGILARPVASSLASSPMYQAAFARPKPRTTTQFPMKSAAIGAVIDQPERAYEAPDN